MRSKVDIQKHSEHSDVTENYQQVSDAGATSDWCVILGFNHLFTINI